MNYIAMGLAMIAAVLVSFRIMWGWPLWIISNIMWMYLYWKKDWGLFWLMTFYQGVCVNGILQWSR